VEVEQALMRMADDSFSPTFLRAATAYGVTPRLRGDVVVNNLVGSAITRGEVRLLSDGRSWRPLLHVEDMCRAFLAVVEAPREAVHNEPFNVAPPGENYQIRDLAEMVADSLSGCEVTFADGAGRPDPRSYRVDSAKLYSAVPAFRPTWTVGDGIRQIFAALEPMNLTEGEFFGPRFMRLEHLQSLIRAGLLTESLYWQNAEAMKMDSLNFGGAGSTPLPAPGP
jgi:nucleoside-diphosphate-sugar epimerase